MNKIGFNTLVWSAAVSDELFPIVEKLKEIGYDGVECLIGAPDNDAYRRFGKHTKDIGLETTAVFVVGKDENPVDPSPAIRAKALDRIKWGIDRAHDMNATILCGPFHSAHAVFSKQAPQEDEYKWCAEVLNQAGDHAASAGITLALEALNRFECYLCNTMEQLSKLVAAASHPNVKAMYDTQRAAAKILRGVSSARASTPPDMVRPPPAIALLNARPSRVMESSRMKTSAPLSTRRFARSMASVAMRVCDLMSMSLLLAHSSAFGKWRLKSVTSSGRSSTRRIMSFMSG